MSRYNININNVIIEFPSVTEIIDGCFDKSDALIPWAVGNCLSWIKENINESMSYNNIIDTINLSRYKYRDVSKEACDNGSQVHSLIEDYIKFGIDKTSKREYNESIRNAFIAFLTWEKDNNVKWIESELMVYSTEIWVAGRLDATCYYQDKRYCLDFKSSKGFYDSYDLQISAYPMIYNDMLIGTDQFTKEKEILNCGILRLDKESGMPEFKDYSNNIERKWLSFNKLVDFFYLYKNRRLKNNPRIKIMDKII